ASPSPSRTKRASNSLSVAHSKLMAAPLPVVLSHETPRLMHQNLKRNYHVATARRSLVGVYRPRNGGLPGGDDAAANGRQTPGGADGDGATGGAAADQQRRAKRHERQRRQHHRRNHPGVRNN